MELINKSLGIKKKMEFVQTHKTLPIKSVYYIDYNTPTMRELLITCLFHQLIVIKLDFIFLPWNIFILEKPRMPGNAFYNRCHPSISTYLSFH